jgi:hypothetical protein
MNALDWIRSKATQYEVDTFTTDEGVTIRATRYSFRGRIQPRMVFEARKLYPELVNHDMQVETLKVGGQHRSEFGQCEYFRTEYEQVAA